jgi:DNA-binding CsgD family transcriptional regulator
MYSSTHHPTDQDVARLWYAGMQALEVLGIGWLVCDAEGRVMSADPIASRILKAQDGLRLNSDGVPCATRGGRELVVEAVQRAARASLIEVQEDHRVALIVRRATGKRAFALLVRPIRAKATAENCARSAAVVLILDSSLSVQATAAELRQLCGFTPAEAELANLLMDGLSLDDCADQLSVLRATAGARLRRMFRKTGVRGQNELVSVLLKTIGLVRLRSEKGKLLTRRSEELLEQTVNREPESPSNAHILHVV